MTSPSRFALPLISTPQASTLNASANGIRSRTDAAQPRARDELPDGQGGGAGKRKHEGMAPFIPYPASVGANR
jgi:hypothetical protein